MRSPTAPTSKTERKTAKRIFDCWVRRMANGLVSPPRSRNDAPYKVSVWAGTPTHPHLGVAIRPTRIVAGGKRIVVTAMM